jgi:hypothetical protein
MTPINIVKRGGRKGDTGERGDEYDEIHCMYTWKYHNETPCTINIC